MKNEEIKPGYDLFQIPVEKIPHYENTNQFAGSFKKCFLYEYVSITYSGSTMNCDKTVNRQKTD